MTVFTTTSDDAGPSACARAPASVGPLADPFDLALEEWAPYVLTSADLVRRGLNRSAVARSVARGDLVSLRRGVHLDRDVVNALPGAPQGPRRWALRTVAWWRTARIPAVVSHASAALLWGVRVPREPDAVHLTTGPAHRSERRGVVLHRDRRFDPSAAETLHGVRLTGPARTAADCLRTMPWPAGTAVCEGFLRRGLCSREEIVRETWRDRGEGDGGCRVRALASRADPERVDAVRREWSERVLPLGLASPRSGGFVECGEKEWLVLPVGWPEARLAVRTVPPRERPVVSCPDGRAYGLDEERRGWESFLRRRGVELLGPSERLPRRDEFLRADLERRGVPRD